MTYLIFLAIPAAAVLDRLRGDAKGAPKFLESIVYGLVIGFALGLPYDGWQMYAFGVLFAVGAAPGWGEPLGALFDERGMFPERLEWWQVGPLKKHILPALIARGALWGIPVLALYYWHPEVVAVLATYVVAFPAAAYIGRKIKGSMGWELMEYIRGGLGAAGVLLFRLI